MTEMNNESATRQLNEAKLLVVGQGGVGKTSLVMRLLSNTFDPYTSKTEGINISPYDISVGNQIIRLKIWDFGGQEIMHATHQFFLTKRSLYLLVLDARQTPEQSGLEYWLKIIQSFGGDSPIIVVINKIDQHSPDFLDKVGLLRKYPNINAFVNTSCKTNQGIDQLRNSIALEVSSLPHVQDQLPSSWFNVKEQLENMKYDYITYDTYQSLCKQQNIDEKSQQILIRFLHDLGVVLNFQDDPRLTNTAILNPKWVTSGIYQILNSQLLFEHRGLLELSYLREILNLEEYPVHTHSFILDMMSKFELLFPLMETDKYLVPDLLSIEQPSSIAWTSIDELRFEYHYDILPKSIITRLMVRLHTYIPEGMYWRNGFLVIYEDNRALIHADNVDSKIEILVDGKPSTRRTLLAIIRSQVGSIHKTIPRLQVREVVPLLDSPNVTIDYADLLQLEKKGIETYYFPKADTEIDVQRLLDGIRSDSGVPLSQTQIKLISPTQETTLADLENIKSRLDENATRQIQRMLLTFLFSIFAIWILLIIVVTQVRWDNLEFWTYVIGVGVPIIAYLYFVITQNQISPLKIYHQLIQQKMRENYETFGFDLARYRNLQKSSTS